MYPPDTLRALLPKHQRPDSRSRAQYEPRISRSLDFVRYLQGDRSAIAGNSIALARHRAEIALLQTDRILALLCRMEAIADHRADNDVSAVAKLPTLRDLAREAIEAHTRTPFNNPLFPLRSPRPY